MKDINSEKAEPSYSITKSDFFGIFHQANLTGSGFLNRAGAEICC